VILKVKENYQNAFEDKPAKLEFSRIFYGKRLLEIHNNNVLIV
jgi:hypothetical protein